jgi:hypothetical protein
LYETWLSLAFSQQTERDESTGFIKWVRPTGDRANLTGVRSLRRFRCIELLVSLGCPISEADLRQACQLEVGIHIFTLVAYQDLETTRASLRTCIDDLMIYHTDPRLSKLDILELYQKVNILLRCRAEPSKDNLHGLRLGQAAVVVIKSKSSEFAESRRIFEMTLRLLQRWQKYYAGPGRAEPVYEADADWGEIMEAMGNVAKRETMERLDKTIPGGFKKNRQESTVVVSEVATVYVSTRLPDAPSHPSSHLPAASL